MSDRPATDDVTPLGWHVISGEALLDCLRAVEAGESPDMVYAAIWAASSHEHPSPDQWRAEVTVAGFTLALSRGG